MTVRPCTGLALALVAILSGAACLYEEKQRCPAGYVYKDEYRACFCATAPRPLCPADAAVVDAEPDATVSGSDAGSDAEASCEGGCP
jgi:hypothetical protein